MIYLKNNTLLQDVYIPRQDMLPYTTGSSGTYAEGYSDGYEDGTQDQKDKLASTAFTENGLYTREDGWNEVEVSVEAPLPVLEDKTVVISADTTTVTPSSGYDGMSAVTVDASGYAQTNYDNGFDDGFEDGYASGSTDERDKLSAVTFTANTQVLLDDGGYSAVTVNVPTGHTDQELEEAYESGHTEGMEDQKALLSSTAFTENGSYQRENGWSGITVNIDTASTYNSGYTDGYDSGYTSGETHQKSLLVSTAITQNGLYQRENGYSAITVNVPQTGGSGTTKVITPVEYIHTANLLEYGDSTYIDTGIYPTTATTFMVKGMYKGYNNGNFIVGYQFPDNGDYRLIFAGYTEKKPDIYYDFNNERLGPYTNLLKDGDLVDIVCDNYSITLNGTVLGTGDTQYTVLNPYKDTIKLEVGSWWVKSLEIWEGETKVFDGQAAYDDSGNIGMYDSVTKELFYNSELTMGYEALKIEDNRQYTVTENGNYTIMPTSYGIVYLYNVLHFFIKVSGYTEDKYIGHLEKWDGTERIDISWNSSNNSLTADTTNWSQSDIEYIEIDVDSQGNDTLYIDFDDYGGTWFGDGDTGFTYDVMSSVNLNVNVPQTGSSIPLSSITITSNTAITETELAYSAITVNVPQTGHTDQELEDAFESGYTSGSTDGFNSGYTSGETHQKSLLVSTAFTQNGIYSKEDGYSAVTVNVPQQTANLGVKTITANGTYSASTDSLDGYSAVTVNISGAKKLYVTVNGVKKNVQYYSEEATVWNVVNENYTTDTPLEIFYVHYYEYKFHIYLLPSGKYGYWDEEENSQQPQTITTINGSATTQDSRSIYTMEEDGTGLIVTSNNGSFYEVLVSEEIMSELSAITITSNTAITVNNGGYSAITVNVPQTGSSADLIPYIERTLTRIDVPSGCTKVGPYAFDRCYSATSITIPDSVTFLDIHAFAVCDEVTAITFGNGLVTIGDSAFYKVGYMSQVVNNNNLVLPDSVSSINSNAFLDMPITAITFGSGTTYLGDEILAHTPVEVIYSYATSAPQLRPLVTSGGTYYRTFRYMNVNNGTVHYPSGSDYSRWQNNQYLSGWTFVADL